MKYELLTLHNPVFASAFVTQYGAEKPAINKIKPEKNPRNCVADLCKHTKLAKFSQCKVMSSGDRIQDLL